MPFDPKISKDLAERTDDVGVRAVFTLHSLIASSNPVAFDPVPGLILHDHQGNIGAATEALHAFFGNTANPVHAQNLRQSAEHHQAFAPVVRDIQRAAQNVAARVSDKQFGERIIARHLQ